MKGIDFLETLSAPPVASRNVAPPAGDAHARLHLTLRAKGLVALVALVVYGAIIAFYVSYERAGLLDIVQRLERVHGDENSLNKVITAVTHSIVVLQDVLNSDNIAPRFEEIQNDIASIAANLPDVKEKYPETARLIGRFEQHFVEFSNWRSRDALIVLRDSGQQLAAELEKLESEAHAHGGLLYKEYRELNYYITVFVSVMNLLGLVVFGVAVTLFLSKLTSDINRLEARAVAVVGGYRAKPLEITRNDEVGGLMQAVNRIQRELSRQERQQELLRQQRFHQEKMAAVGSLAAAVAHEISNPINSISGIAQHTTDAIRSGQRPDDETLCDNAEHTLKQTERIGSIVRQLAELSAPRSPDPELLHVNELVRTTCSFIRYDKRFRHIDLVPDLDRELPAVRAVADHLTQVLMNLLINAADAMEGVADRKPTIRVSTRQAEGEIILSVSDNGNGMDPEVLTHAFEQSFTTKPAGKGRGIGLYLCKTLIEEIGGRIELESTPGAGATAQVRLPCGVPGRALA